MRNIIRKSVYVGVLFLIFSGIISCEKDFTDIGTSIIGNSKFSTKDTILEVLVTNAPVESVIADGLSLTGGLQDQYLLGNYVNDDYESVEASIISQVAINTSSELVTYDNPDNLEVVTTIDTVFIKLPYQATLISNTTRPIYELDSVIGNQELPFTLNVYELDTYLSRLNQTDPTKVNQYLSNATYQNKGIQLNELADIDFTPSVNDTLMIIKRRTNDGNLYATDTVKYTTTSNANLPLPIAFIPLKKNFGQNVFLDNFGGDNFASQDVFNNYFRGITIEAKEKTHASGEKGGSLIGFDFSNTSSTLNPSIEIYYTNTFLRNGTIDTVFTRNRSFQLSGIVNNSFKMTDKVYPSNNEVKLQGLAGSEATVKILNGTELTDLRNKNWLINDAALTFYVNQSSDITIVPNNLFLYKNGGGTNLSHVKDSYSEQSFFGGALENESDNPNKYTFKITDYISDLLSGETDYSPELRLKVFNTSDTPISDTIYKNYNWSPKAVTILNHDETLNGTRRAQLKISYSERKN